MAKKKLFYVQTGNRHGQILIFTSQEDAYNWLKSATILTEEEINEAIKEAIYMQNYYSVFQG